MPSPFGLHYPTELQRSVNHAERLAALLATPELESPEVPWVLGRAGEIASFVECILADWRAGREDEVGALVAIEAYLAELHVGLRAHYGILHPQCCDATSTDEDEQPLPGE